MRKIFILISNRHDLLYRVLLITLSVLLITAFLPRKHRFHFTYMKGGIWSYQDLKAPFDFLLYKTEAEINREREEMNAGMTFVFRRDSAELSKALRRFDLSYRGPGKESGVELMRELYKRGLIEIPGENQELKNSDPAILIFTGNSAQSSTVSAHIRQDQLRKWLQRSLQFRELSSYNGLFEAWMLSVVPDITYDQSLTQSIHAEQLSKISPVKGKASRGILLISRGQYIGEKEFETLESLRRAYTGDNSRDVSRIWLYAGYLILVISAISVLLSFLWLLRKDILKDSRRMTLLFLLITITCIGYSLLLDRSQFNLLLVPLCILPLVTRAFFDTRTALFTHVLTVLILGTVAPSGFDFVFMQTIAGMVAIFSIVNMRKRSQLFVAVSLIFLAYLFCFFGLSLLNEGSLYRLNTSDVIWIAANGSLTLLAYPIIFLLEKAFRVTSDFTLMELTDFNNEALRELALKAPGTFQHSLQVANLAEAAIFRIGGNSLLVRVGALYHDIGKLDMPMYFIENQSTGVNPHDELSFEESAEIIIGHVVHGLERARKYKLPEVIMDFIRSHHGTSVVQYFYQNFLKSYPGEEVDVSHFTYPGPKPFSKETAVLMMADSVEAASRSIDHPNADSLSELVDRIIDHQIEDAQFENCDITFKDISQIRKIFKKMLGSIYHVRVSYPGA